jgi:hypothetical protein
VLENEATHLIMCSIESDDPILPITVNRTGVPVFWSKTLWMRFFQDTGCLRFVGYFVYILCGVMGADREALELPTSTEGCKILCVNERQTLVNRIRRKHNV